MKHVKSLNATIVDYRKYTVGNSNYHKWHTPRNWTNECQCKINITIILK